MQPNILELLRSKGDVYEHPTAEFYDFLFLYYVYTNPGSGDPIPQPATVGIAGQFVHISRRDSEEEIIYDRRNMGLIDAAVDQALTDATTFEAFVVAEYA